MVYKSSLCSRDLGGNFELNKVLMTYQMQVHIQGRWEKKCFTYTAPVKTKQSKQYQISAPKYLRISERIWCLRLHVHGKSNLSGPLTKIPLFLIFMTLLDYGKLSAL